MYNLNLDVSAVSLAAGLVAATLAARLRVAGSAFLIHHMGSHSRNSDEYSPRIAQWVGIATLSTHVDDYKAAHITPHHGKDFATLADPDAAFLHWIGFRPGTSYYKSWLLFWWTLVSPRFHARLTLARLRGVFTQGPEWRQRCALWFWGGVLILAGLIGVLPGLLLSFVLPLLILGNAASLAELTSEHIWFTELDMPKKERHARLSHGRHLGVMPPEGGQRFNPVAWAWWLARTALAAVLRFTVLPGDLPWHHRHHTGGGVDDWMNASKVYSQQFWNDEGQQRHAAVSLGHAIGRWFRALAATKP